MEPGGKSRRDWVGRIRGWIFKVKKEGWQLQKRKRRERERKGKKGEDEKRNEKK